MTKVHLTAYAGMCSQSWSTPALPWLQWLVSSFLRCAPGYKRPACIVADSQEAQHAIILSMPAAENLALKGGPAFLCRS